MEFFDLIRDWSMTNPGLFGFVKYLLWAGFILFSIQFLRRLLKKWLPDSATRYKSQKGIEIFGYILLIILTITYFTGSIKDFALAFGLMTAGITITLQELILSVAGSVFIFIVKVYKPGDRIQINGIKGDVIDINSVYTTMMEIGEWVSSDNYSGRIVKLSNAFVFKGPIYNYSQDFPFIWDELNIPIKHGSDIEIAKSLVISIAIEILSDYTTASHSQWKKVVDKYYIEDAIVAPTLAITLNDNWVQLNLRYIVDYKKRRATKHLLHERIREEIKKTEKRVELASTTIEIVGFPEIKVNSGREMI